MSESERMEEIEIRNGYTSMTLEENESQNLLTLTVCQDSSGSYFSTHEIVLSPDHVETIALAILPWLEKNGYNLSRGENDQSNRKRID